MKIRTKKGTSGVRKLVNPVCLVREQQESPRDSCEDWKANRIQKSLSLILNSIAITSRNLVPFDRHMSFRFTDIYYYTTILRSSNSNEKFFFDISFFLFFWEKILFFENFHHVFAFNFCLIFFNTAVDL